MNKILGISIAALALAAGWPQPAEAQACDVSYRIWQDGQNTYYKPGDWVPLRVGESADLYIHGPQSRSADPYSASADIGAPTDFGVGGQRPQDVQRVLRLGHHDPRKGKISFTAVAAGQTALGYRITDVVRPGRLEDIPPSCRTGQVRINVEGTSRGVTAPPPSPSPPPSQSVNEATHELIGGLFNAILRRAPSDYPNEWFDRVQRGGLRGLIFVAETMTSSPEFRTAAVSRTREALQKSGVAAGNLSPRVVEEQLLSDICRSLYGQDLAGEIRSLMSSKLSSCLAGNSNLCRQLGQDLVSQRQYYENHRRLLDLWRRY